MMVKKTSSGWTWPPHSLPWSTASFHLHLALFWSATWSNKFPFDNSNPVVIFFLTVSLRSITLCELKGLLLCTLRVLIYYLTVEYNRWDVGLYFPLTILLEYWIIFHFKVNRAKVYAVMGFAIINESFWFWYLKLKWNAYAHVICLLINFLVLLAFRNPKAFLA